MLNFALVGCGKIAARHAQLLGNNEIKNARLSAVCDKSKVTAQEMARQFKVPFYTEIAEMMEKEKDLHAVSVLTPSGLHAENVVELSGYKKHIIVEKPMALVLDDADRMIRACDENGTKLFVVKQNRFNVPVQKLHEAIVQKRFGKMVMGTVRVRWCRKQDYYDANSWRGTWAFDGGVFANQASHHIDLLEWMMGDVESVFAKSITALVNIETEDTGIAVLKFRNGALGIIEATTATRPKDLEGSLSVLGEKGSVEIGGFAVNQMKTWNFVDKTAEDDLIFSKYAENPQHPYGYSHKAFYDHVVDCILNDKKALIDGLEGRKSLELISAFYESIETGREVILRFRPQKCKLGIK